MKSNSKCGPLTRTRRLLEKLFISSTMLQLKVHASRLSKLLLSVHAKLIEVKRIIIETTNRGMLMSKLFNKNKINSKVPSTEVIMSNKCTKDGKETSNITHKKGNFSNLASNKDKKSGQSLYRLLICN